MLKIYGYFGFFKKQYNVNSNQQYSEKIDQHVVMNQIMWLCGITVTLNTFTSLNLPRYYIFTVCYLLFQWILIVSNIYAT